MALLASVKNFLERNAEQLRAERGFWADVGFVINQNLAEITPDTTYGSASDHFQMAAASFGEQMKAAGGGIKQVLWDEPGRFAMEMVHRSRAKDPLHQGIVAGFYGGLYYAKAFTYDAVAGIGKAVMHGGKSLVQAGTMEEILLAESEILGGVGAAAGMGAAAAGIPQIASKIGSLTVTLPAASGSELALAAVSVPTGSVAAAAMPGAIGISFMAMREEDKIWDDGKDEIQPSEQISPLEANTIVDELEDSLASLTDRYDKALLIEETFEDIVKSGLLMREVQDRLLALAGQHRCLGQVMQIKEGIRVTLRQVVEGKVIVRVRRPPEIIYKPID